ncbi:hypothetical protein EDB80DRAFT_686897 [Ilyonectria destructans]|nr:hypothetical protein EDB80DRAFT_686897 [Ilyonectria destructans]
MHPHTCTPTIQNAPSGTKHTHHPFPISLPPLSHPGPGPGPEIASCDTDKSDAHLDTDRDRGAWLFHAASHSQYQRPLIGESPRLRPVRVPRAPSPLISPFVRNTGPSLRPQGGSNTKQIRKTYADIPETNPPTSRCYVLSSTPSYQDKLSALPKCPLLTNPVCPNPGPNLADAALFIARNLVAGVGGPEVVRRAPTFLPCSGLSPVAPTSPSKYSILTLPQPIVGRSPPSGPSAAYAVLTTPLNSARPHHHSCSRGIAESGGTMIKCETLLSEWRASSLVGLRRSFHHKTTENGTNNLQILLVDSPKVR